MTVMRNKNWRIGTVGLSMAILLSLSGLAIAATDYQSASTRARTAIEQIVESGQLLSFTDDQIMSRLEAEGLFAGANGIEVRREALTMVTQYRSMIIRGTQLEGTELPPGAGMTPNNPIRLGPAIGRHATGRAGSVTEEWTFDSGEQARSGFYTLPAGHTTIYNYENDFVFRSGSTSAAQARNMDVITFGGSCPVPPMQITAIEFLFRMGATGNVRREIRVWDTYTQTAAPGVHVGSNLLSTLVEDHGTLIGPTNFFLEIVTLSTPISPTHSDNIAVQWDYVDNVTGVLTSAQPWFALGPAAPTEVGTCCVGAPPVGSSENFFFRDVNLDGLLTSNERLFFSTVVANRANFNLHIGGQVPGAEIEANDTALTATALCDCEARPAMISPAADPDWFSFRVAEPNRYELETLCGANDTTLKLYDTDGVTVIAMNDDIDAGNLCSRVTTAAALNPGQYFAEVHDKGDDGTFAYEMSVKPLADSVSGLVIAPDKSTVSWDPDKIGSRYDVIRGNIAELHIAAGDYTNVLALTDCWDTNLANPSTVDPTTPFGPGDSLFYLARTRKGCSGSPVGSYNSGGLGQVGDRDPEIATNPNTSSCP